MSKERLCINCKRFGEDTEGKFYCFLNGEYNNIIHNPEQESCNFFELKEAKK